MRLAVAGHPPPLLVDGETVIEAAGSDPVLGAFARRRVGHRARPGRARPAARRRSPTGSPRRRGRRGASARSACAPTLAAPPTRRSPCSELEGSLHAFTEGALDDDVAMLAIARASGARRRRRPERSHRRSAGRTAMPSRAGAGRAALSSASTAATRTAIVALCDEAMEFFPVVTAEAVGREAPYVAPTACATTSPTSSASGKSCRSPRARSSARGGSLLVRGRVYAPQPRARHPRRARGLDLGGRATAASSAARSSPIPSKPCCASPSA